MNKSPIQPATARFRQASCLRRRGLANYRYVRMRWRVLFGCIDAVGTFLFAAFRMVSGWHANRARREELRRILLVQFDHLGDAILTTAMFEPLRRRFPRARIDVLAAPWNRAVFESTPEIERVFVCRRNRFGAGLKLAWIPATLAWGLRLRKERYDLAIDVRGEFPHNVLIWLSGARRRIGWASGGGGFLLTDAPAYVANRPEIDSRAALLGCLGIACGERLQPAFQPDAAATELARAAWSEFPVAERPARIVLHVGAGTSAKRWPAEHWRHLAERLIAERHAVVALVGTSHDTQTARAVLGPSPSPQVADWTGRFTLNALAAVLQQSDLLVGADSGPAHLATAVATPVVALFSGTNCVEQWQPRGSAVRIVRHETPCSPCHRKTCPLAGHPCMRGIRPDHVLRAVADLIPDRPAETLLATSTRNTKAPTP